MSVRPRPYVSQYLYISHSEWCQCGRLQTVPHIINSCLLFGAFSSSRGSRCWIVQTVPSWSPSYQGLFWPESNERRQATCFVADRSLIHKYAKISCSVFENVLIRKQFEYEQMVISRYFLIRQGILLLKVLLYVVRFGSGYKPSGQGVGVFFQFLQCLADENL